MAIFKDNRIYDPRMFISMYNCPFWTDGLLPNFISTCFLTICMFVCSVDFGVSCTYCHVPRCEYMLVMTVVHGFQGLAVSLNLTLCVICVPVLFPRCAVTYVTVLRE